MTWIDGLRCEHGKNIFHEISAQHPALTIRQSAVRAYDDAVVAQLDQNLFIEATNLRGDHRPQEFVDLFELGCRREAVQRQLGYAFVDLFFQPRHSNHEKLVEVGREDRKELDAFEQRL